MTLSTRDAPAARKTMPRAGHKVFAFTSVTVNGRIAVELDESFKQIITSFYARGYDLMPLNPPAIGMARSVDLPYHLMEDWLDEREIIRSKAAAEACEYQWYKPAEQGFRSDGILWPLFDDDAMYWFWRDVTYADIFVKAFLAGGGERFAYVMNSSLRPALYYFDSDINGALWQVMLGNRAQPFILDLQPGCESFRPHAIRFESRYGTSLKPILTALKGRIVFVLNHGEIHRFQTAIRQLAEQFPDKVALVLLNPATRDVVRRAQALSIPFICPILAPVGDGSLAGQFLEAYQTAVARSTDRFWARPLKALGFHFEYYCRNRWPALAQSFRSWLNLWKHHRPAAVVVSSLRDAESQLPCEAANRFNVPTFSIPHGGSWMKTGRPGASKFFLYQNPFQKIRALREGLSLQRLIPCRDVLQINEYPVQRIRAYPAGAAWHVLALTNEVGIGNTLSPRTVVRAQLQALQALAQVPGDIAPRMSLSIKVHPNYPDLDLYPAVSDELADKVLPPNSDLEAVINETHLVIAVNYSYVAAAHAMQAGVPVIFFWTDPLIFGQAEPQKNADLLLAGGVMVRTAGDLWSVVRRFFIDSAFAADLRTKARQFMQQTQDSESYHRLADVVRQVLPPSASPLP